MVQTFTQKLKNMLPISLYKEVERENVRWKDAPLHIISAIRGALLI